MSVISLPDRDETVKQAVEAVWDFLEEAEDPDDVKRERKKSKVNAVLAGISDDEVFAEIQARRGFQLEQQKSVKQAEMETLVASKEELGNDRPDGSFFARSLPKAVWSRPWMDPIDRVCSNDPCRQHEPQNTNEHRFFVGHSLSWLPAHCRNLVRTAQRLPGSGPGGAHG